MPGTKVTILDIRRRGKRLIKQLLGIDPWTSSQIKISKEYHGLDFGRWCISPALLSPESVVYSFGVGEDISFDLSIINKFGVIVHAFDPTPRSVNMVKSSRLSSSFVLYEYGVADYDGSAMFNPPENPQDVSHTLLPKAETAASAIQVPVCTLRTIMKTLGHQHIDLLKMDIEGAEYQVIDDLIASGIQVDQLLVEFHHRFKTVPVSQTKQTIEKLNEYGFRIFNISPSGEEYSFVSLRSLDQ